MRCPCVTAASRWETAASSLPWWWLSLVTSRCLQCPSRRHRALSCSFCHLSWSALAERWCLSRVSADLRGGAAALQGLSNPCRATGWVSCSWNGAGKASAPPLGDINPFPSQIKGVPLCFGVMDQQSSWIPDRELWNVDALGGWVRSMVPVALTLLFMAQGTLG